MELKAYYIECSRPLGSEVFDKYPHIQVLDAGLIAGRDHIEHALSQAKKAFERGSNISSDPLIEPIVRASAQRQIKKALDIFGIKNSRKAYVLAGELPVELLTEYGCVERGGEDITGEKYEALKKAFSIREAEISAVAGKEFKDRVKALQDAIKERITLLEAF